MPFQSEKQRRYLHANHPEIAKRWEKEYAHGGILDITGDKEITTDHGNDIELTAFNAEFDDPNDLSTGVKTLFRAKDGGTPQLAKKSKDGTRPGYRGSDWGPGAGSPGTTSSGGNKNTGGDRHSHPGIASQYSSPKTSAPSTVSIGPSLHGGPSVKETLTNLADKQHEQAVNTEFEGTVELPYALDLHGITPSKAQRRQIHNRNVNVKKEKYEKALAEQKSKMKKMGLSKLIMPAVMIAFGIPPKVALKSITVTPKDLLTAVKHGLPVADAKKEYLEALEMSNRVILSDVDITNPNEMRSIEETTNYVENMKTIKDLTPKPKDDDDTGGDGPPEVVPVHEEIRAYEDIASQPMGLLGMRDNKALYAALSEEWSDQRAAQEQEYKDYGLLPDNPIVMGANSGGLANLFRVKKQ